MAKKKEYEVGVSFTTTLYVTVSAYNLDHARELAEEEASEEFEEQLNDGLFGSSDFSCKVYKSPKQKD